MAAASRGLLLDDAVTLPEDATRLRETRVAIVTYEYVGLTRTGGIGTAYTALARALAAAGAQVDVLFTGEPDPGASLEGRRDELRGEGVHLHWLEEEVRALALGEHAPRAWAAWAWLREREPYDVVHVPETAGHGAYLVQAKRARRDFAGTTIAVGTHGSSRWVRDVNGEPAASVDLLALGELERRSVELADVVISPSAYLLGDMRARGWALPQRTFVQQYVKPPAATDVRAAPTAQVRELVFFGRQETRKGFELFLEALDRLVGEVRGADLGVTFLGRSWVNGGRPSADALAEHRARWPWPVQVLDGLDQPEALAYLCGEGRVAVMPSLVDNLPLAVLEALSLGVPFITCATGGIGELIDERDHERSTAAPEPDALAAALRRALDDPPPPARFAVDPADNLDAHLRWHAALAGTGRETAVVETAPATGYELVTSERHVLDDDARATLEAAAAASGADAVTFAVRTADDRVLVPLGGPPELGVVDDVFSTGSALVRGDLLGHAATGDVALHARLAALAQSGGRILVLPEPLADEREPGRGDALARAGELATAPPRPGQELDVPVMLVYESDLPATVRDLRDRLGDVTAALARADRLVIDRHAEADEARELIREREVQLAAAQEELVVYEHRLTTLQNRKVVKAALALADVALRVARR